MAQSQSIRTDLPFLSFLSVFTRIRNRSTTRPYQQLSRVVSKSARLPSVDKLLAKEVLVPDIKAAEDLNLGPVSTTPAASVAHALLHAPHQPSDMALTKLIVLPIRRRKPKARKPVAAIVVHVMGDFIPEVFQNPMFLDVIGVCLRRLGGPD